MSSREAFIKLIQSEIFDKADKYTENDAELFSEIEIEKKINKEVNKTPYAYWDSYDDTFQEISSIFIK